MIGYAFSASYCTFAKSLDAMSRLVSMGYKVLPIMSERAYATDTRFFLASEFRKRVEEISGERIIHDIASAEPLGPEIQLDALIIAPCTGNTLAKIARGITDSSVTMAAKAHLRCDRPLLLALASNDAMSQNLTSLGMLVGRRSVYFVPMRQDDTVNKPYSLVAEMSRIPEALAAMLEGRQIRPLFV